MPTANTQFSIAVHLMAALGFYGKEKVTSTELAQSINAAPSFVRRILAKLSKAGLVKTTAGKSGCCSLGKPVSAISMLDIYKALAAGPLMTLHPYPAIKKCPVSCYVRRPMDKILTQTQKYMEAGLQKISLAHVVADIKRQCR